MTNQRWKEYEDCLAGHAQQTAEAAARQSEIKAGGKTLSWATTAAKRFFAGGNTSSGKFFVQAEKIADCAGQVRQKMSHLGPAMPGTTIPEHFRLVAGGHRFQVIPSASRHVGKYIRQLPTASGFSLRNDLILSSLDLWRVEDLAAFGKTDRVWWLGVGLCKAIQ